MLMGRALNIEGRRGSQRRLDEGGRHLGIPWNRDFAAPREGSERVDDHQLSAAQCPGNRVRYNGDDGERASLVVSWTFRSAAHRVGCSRDAAACTSAPRS